MKRLIALLITVCFSHALLAQVNYALLIGIENYPEDSGWHHIHAHNDLTLVKNTLLSNGFDSSCILELRDEQATYASIKDAFKKLAKIAKKGDSVTIFFSCHGQRITDLNGDEEDGYDEAMIPFDAGVEYGKNGYKGEHHLIDDEINSLMAGIRKSIGYDGHLLALFDACHSGDTDRDPEDTVRSGDFRGIDVDFIIPSSKRTKTKSTPPKREWSSISACLDYQTNYEIEVNGKTYGRLAYSFCNSWTSNTSDQALVEAIQCYYKTLPKTPKGFVQVIDYNLYTPGI